MSFIPNTAAKQEGLPYAHFQGNFLKATYKPCKIG